MLVVVLLCDDDERGSDSMTLCGKMGLSIALVAYGFVFWNLKMTRVNWVK